MNSKTAASDENLNRPAPLPRLFRSIDWWTFGVTFAVIWVVYFCCLAPEVTLEDSGELCTGSFYAGIPHAPGYPFWTIYTWFWTVLLPFKNVAWRVSVAEASTASLACGLVGLMVSRGSSMLMEGIEELKSMTGRWENAICLVAGVTAGLLMGLDGSTWSESVVINRISIFGVPWLMLVLTSLLRWNYDPSKRGYLYVGMFFFGICATIHQTLTIAAMGIEIGIALRAPKLGRDLFLANCLAYIAGLIAKSQHMVGFFDMTTPMVFTIFNGIGLASIAACIYLTLRTGGLGSEWKPVLIMGLLWASGAAFYFWEPISGMTNPPMEWSYPRTVEGFWHAISRGQYGQITPTDIFHDPGQFMMELGMLVTGLADAFSWVGMFFALLPFLFLWKMRHRERAWLAGLSAIFVFLGVLLSIFLNPSRERQSAELVKVFFTPSHALVSILIGYGLALTAAFMATHYGRFRRWGLVGGGVAVALALYSLADITGKHFFGLDGEVSLGDLPHWVARAFAPRQYGSPVIAGLLLLVMTLVFVAAVIIYKQRAPLGITLALFAGLPVVSAMSHWFSSEQHDHWFGYWFGHDMFTPPFTGPDGKLTYDPALRDAAAKGPHGKMVYPEMARDAVLYGGTDPGRFCPTYTIFCESFIPHDCQPKQDQRYDRRDVYIITQNALADGTYLDYIRAQYNRSTQIDPPFFQNFLRDSLPSIFHSPTTLLKPLDTLFEGIGARVERRRRTSTSWFHPDQFTNVQNLAGHLKPGPRQDSLSAFLYGKLSPETQRLVTGGGSAEELARALSKDLNAILQEQNIYSAERFKNIHLPLLVQQAATDLNLTSNNIIRLNRVMLEDAYPDAIVKSLGGVYPDTEIKIPSPEEAQRSSSDYVQDATRRWQHDMQHPGEPRQLHPGEEVHPMPNGQVQVGGQIAVFGINGEIAKWIFNQNPDHDFYVEESLPLDWMYPYLTPFGIIMKVNRHPTGLTQDMIDKDHAFWSEYSQRSIGNWITYDTSIKQICDWVDQVYLRHDFSQFTGDERFMRDEDGQKAFSKLRCSVGNSVFYWRSQHSGDNDERTRARKEAEFALKQSFAFCPYSPEAVFDLMNLLLSQNRIDESVRVLKTCHNLDPFNRQITDWIEQLSRAQTQPAGGNASLQQAFSQVEQALAAHQTNVAEQLLQRIVQAGGTSPAVLINAAEIFVRIGDLAQSEDVVAKLTQLMPNSSQAWYNMAIIQSHRGEMQQAMASLKKSLEMNDAERAKDPSAYNLRQHLAEDPSIAPLRDQPGFKSLNAH